MEKATTALNKINELEEQIQAIKLELAKPVAKPAERVGTSPEFIAAHKSKWQEVGSFYKGLRESLGLSKAKVAKYLGCSPTKVSNFELGRCVSEPKLFEMAYDTMIDRELFDMGERIGYHCDTIEKLQNLMDDETDEKVWAGMLSGFMQNNFDAIFEALKAKQHENRKEALPYGLQ